MSGASQGVGADRAPARVMSPWAAFQYNVLTMGLIFPWTYLWAPYAFPGGDLALGILFALLVEIPIALAYVWLASALPLSGGSYVYLSRLVGLGFGFTVVFSGYVIWVLQWLALAGWMFAVLGLAPLMAKLGLLWQSPWLIRLAVAVLEPRAVVAITVAGSLAAVLLLAKGLGAYVRLQQVMFAGTLLAFALLMVLFAGTDPRRFALQMDRFALLVAHAPHFTETLLGASRGTLPHFSWLATLAVAPIAWTSLQWSTYSVEQNEEVQGAERFRNELFMLLGPTLVTGCLLAGLGYVETRAVGWPFLLAAAQRFAPVLSPQATLLTPFPNVLALVLTANPLLVLGIGLGYLLNSFQIFCNCHIGMSRILVAMARDRLLPSWLAVEVGGAPRNAYYVYFLAGVLWTLAYNLAPHWNDYTLGVTFADGYVFTLAGGLGAFLLPFRGKAAWERSDAPKTRFLGIPLPTLFGALALVGGGGMVLAFLFVPQYGTTGTVPFLLTIGSLLAALVWYSLARAYWQGRGRPLEVGGGEEGRWP